MLRRKITDRLTEWKSDPKRKSLLVHGARQVGKTYSIDDFGKKNYGTYIYINFEKDPRYGSVFAGDKDVDSMIRRMSLFFPDAEFVPGDTLIFLDEIQNCPDARTAFKFFTIDGRYHVIGSGSLMGVRHKEVPSYPVGYEEAIEMASLDFEEFLWAMNIPEQIVNDVKNNIREKMPVDELFLEKFSEYLMWHMITGGMPEAVMTFKETNNFGKVLNVQRNIIRTYIDDIAKYAPASEKNKVAASFYSIPGQLARKNNKFVYAEVEGKKGSRYDTYGNSLLWLREAGIINLCYNLQEPALPLLANRKNNSFKVYMRDTGLLVAMMEGGTAAAMIGGMPINKGPIMENMVADMLAKEGYELTYFEKRGTLEVDFVLNLGGTATAIEVKSGNSRQSKSLGSVMFGKYNVRRGIKLEDTNVFVDEKGVEHYPLFAAAFMRSMSERS